MTAPRPSLESRIGRLLTVGTYASMALVGVGTFLMAANGTSPLATAPSLDVGRIAVDIAALRPAGFLWLGLLILLVTPSARVAAGLVGYLRAGEREMAAVAVLILLVIATGVMLGTSGS